MCTDPHEWKNLAKNTKYSPVIQEHQAFLPKVNRKPAPGSAHRILTRDKNGKVMKFAPMTPFRALRIEWPRLISARFFCHKLAAQA
jgi:hypothetical protein